MQKMLATDLWGPTPQALREATKVLAEKIAALASKPKPKEK